MIQLTTSRVLNLLKNTEDKIRKNNENKSKPYFLYFFFQILNISYVL